MIAQIKGKIYTLKRIQEMRKEFYTSIVLKPIGSPKAIAEAKLPRPEKDVLAELIRQKDKTGEGLSKDDLKAIVITFFEDNDREQPADLHAYIKRFPKYSI